MSLKDVKVTLAEISSEFNKSADQVLNELRMIDIAHASTQKNLKLLADIYYSQLVWRDQWRAINLHKPYVSLIYVDKLMIGANIARTMQENYIFIKLVFEGKFQNKVINNFFEEAKEFEKRLNSYLDTDDSSLNNNYTAPIFQIQHYIKDDIEEYKFYKLCSYLVHVSPKLVDGISKKRVKELDNHFGNVIENYYLKTRLMLLENLAKLKGA